MPLESPTQFIVTHYIRASIAAVLFVWASTLFTMIILGTILLNGLLGDDNVKQMFTYCAHPVCPNMTKTLFSWYLYSLYMQVQYFH